MKKSLSIGTTVIALMVSASACSQTSAGPDAPYVCPAKHVAPDKLREPLSSVVLDQLNKAFDDAIGPDAEHLDRADARARVTSRRVDNARMARLAEVSGCAALIDVHSSCAIYYDPELGSPLSVFMSMNRTAPVRKQFESAIAQLKDEEQKRAAQTCIRLVGKQ